MALHQGIAAIQAGECDAAIIAGVNLLMNPMTSLQILGVGALAPDGKCKVFDAAGKHAAFTFERITKTIVPYEL
jgi:acyl transferase domain-containing protein